MATAGTHKNPRDIEFAEAQGRVLTQILLWLIAALPEDERKAFIHGASGVIIGRVPPAPTTKPAGRRKKGAT